MDNNELERIRNLPDFAASDRLEKEFQQLLIQTKRSNSENNLLLLGAYFELAERQWHTYELISSELLEKIDLILINLWNRESIESTEVLLGIVAHLGLTRTFGKVKSALDSGLLESVRQEILETIEELGNTVADPYSGINRDL